MGTNNIINLPKRHIPLVNQSGGDLPILPLSLIQLFPLLLSAKDVDVVQLSSPLVKLFLLELYSNNRRNIMTSSNQNSLQIIWDDEDDRGVDPACTSKNKPHSTIKCESQDSRDRTKEGENISKLMISSGTLGNLNRMSRGNILREEQKYLNLSTRIVPILKFPSQDPTDDSDVICIARAFSVPYCNYRHEADTTNTRNSSDDNETFPNSYQFEITNGTMVQIMPPILATQIDKDQQLCTVPTNSATSNFGHDRCKFNFVHPPSLLSEVSGVLSSHHQYDNEDFLLFYPKETIGALTIRMRMLMERQLIVGTTDDAVSNWQNRRNSQNRMNHSLDAFFSLSRRNKYKGQIHTNNQNETVQHHRYFQSGTLTVHDPLHGSGKTTLVATIARTELRCDAVHIINASALFAQYGASGADAAFESLLHRIVLSAAATNVSSRSIGSVCIILDKLETFVPPGMSGGRDMGDPAVPALHAIRAYLTKLVGMIEMMGTFPFPTKNPLYNVKGYDGYAIPVKVLLVGIVTCEDDGGRKSFGLGYNSSTVLDTIGESRYRLPSPSIHAGIEICDTLFNKNGITLSIDAKEELPFLVSSMQNMKGSSFQAIVKKLMQLIHTKEDVKLQAGIDDLRQSFMVESNGNGSISVLRAAGHGNDTQSNEDKFNSIGGNYEAKKSLLDALAFDQRKRMLLARFGLTPPTGVLLYGPPGNGKTLLAKATAQMMQQGKQDARAGQNTGGLFISLSASDIVRAEVGASEKLVARAFETARDNAPSVIFIDEFQALFTNRDGVGGGGKSSGRLASTLLQCMDDISKWRGADQSIANSSTEDFESDRVVILGATNTPWMIDRAFLRSGRFDRVVHVGLPTEKERESILRVHVERMKLSSSTTVEEVCKLLASDTLGFSGADIAALVRSAAVQCLNENTSNDEIAVEMRHFRDARKYDLPHPTSNNDLVEKLLKWRP